MTSVILSVSTRKIRIKKLTYWLTYNLESYSNFFILYLYISFASFGMDFPSLSKLFFSANLFGLCLYRSTKVQELHYGHPISQPNIVVFIILKRQFLTSDKNTTKRPPNFCVQWNFFTFPTFPQVYALCSCKIGKVKLYLQGMG